MRKKVHGGGEQIVLEDGAAEIRLPGASPQRLPTVEFIRRLQEQSLRGLDQEALPDNVKYRVDRGGLVIFIAEFKPAVHSVQWIADDSPVPYGPGMKFDTYRLAMPYMVLKAPFINGRLLHMCEVFFRNRPLLKKAHQEELFHCNLLNVSPDAYGCVAWLCTQYLELPKPRGGARLASMTDQLDSVASLILGGILNRSSEEHEGKSCYRLSVEKTIDRRVLDPARWQAETEKDASFILGVDWMPAGVTVGQLIERQLAAARAGGGIESTAEIVNLLLRGQKGG